jgi:hypothetical protein
MRAHFYPEIPPVASKVLPRLVDLEPLTVQDPCTGSTPVLAVLLKVELSSDHVYSHQLVSIGTVSEAIYRDFTNKLTVSNSGSNKRES